VLVLTIVQSADVGVIVVIVRDEDDIRLHSLNPPISGNQVRIHDNVGPLAGLYLKEGLAVPGDLDRFPGFVLAGGDRAGGDHSKNDSNHTSHGLSPWYEKNPFSIIHGESQSTRGQSRRHTLCAEGGSAHRVCSLR